jgi:hypothetical protein
LNDTSTLDVAPPLTAEVRFDEIEKYWAFTKYLQQKRDIQDGDGLVSDTIINYISEHQLTQK